MRNANIGFISAQFLVSWEGQKKSLTAEDNR